MLHIKVIKNIMEHFIEYESSIATYKDIFDGRIAKLREIFNTRPKLFAHLLSKFHHITKYEHFFTFYTTFASEVVAYVHNFI